MLVNNVNERKKWQNNIIWIFIASTLVLLGGDAINAVIIPTISKSQGYLHTFMSYASFITMWIAVIFTVVVFKNNRYIMAFIKKNTQGNTVPFLLVGLLGGFLLNGFCALVAGLHGDIQLSLMRFEFFPVLGLFLAVFLQSSAEEVLCRGYIYQRMLEANSKPVVAIVLNALFFGVFHLFNEGITVLAFYDLCITGVFFSMVVYYFDSLWMAMGLHATWNFTQSILLGLPNSGASFPYSIFKLDASTAHASFAYDTGFGLEGTILSSILMTACCLVIYFWKKSDKPSIWG